MIMLAIDPGGVNGIYWWDDEYKDAGFAQVKLKDLPEWLEAHLPIPDLIVFENYRLWKHKALQQSGSDMPAAQAVGIIKSYTIRNNIDLLEQSPQILKQAELMTQVKMPSDHTQSHWVSAYLHGMYYLMKNGHRVVDLGDLA